VRFTNQINKSLPIIAVDLGYSAKSKSCGIAYSGTNETQSLTFGNCAKTLVNKIEQAGPHNLIIEAVLSTYHDPNGNPSNRGDFEKARGWYYGPGVTTFAAAQRLLTLLDQQLQTHLQIPIIEGFLSYKPARTQHTDDALRMIAELETAETFTPALGSEPILPSIDAAPIIKRYNRPSSK